MELRSFGPSNKSKIKQKTPPTNLLNSGCLKLRVCNNFTIDLNGGKLLRSAVRTRQWAL